MGKSLASKVFSVLAVGIVLAHLSPFAAGMLLCIGDGAGPDCCSKRTASEFRANGAQQLQDRSDCNCCISIDAAPSTAGTTYQKASDHVLSESVAFRYAVSLAATAKVRLVGDDPGSPFLSRLRTIVLLI